MFLWIFLGPDNCLFPPTVYWGLKRIFERFSTISTQFSTVERENSVESRSNWGAAHAQKHRFPQAHSGRTASFADLRSGRAYGGHTVPLAPTARATAANGNDCILRSTGKSPTKARWKFYVPSTGSVLQKQAEKYIRLQVPSLRHEQARSGRTASFAPTAGATAASGNDCILRSTGKSPIKARWKFYVPSTGGVLQKQAEKYIRLQVPSLRHEQARSGRTASFAPTAGAAAANRSDCILRSTGESPTEADGKSPTHREYSAKAGGKVCKMGNPFPAA